ncbi:MAG: type II toxin-antitoxin system VapC family toxin [Actinobacteria bacterium]|nr:type II toxin-antitoxin system VapC family toxin [Actinomycetota bacterium]
MSRLVVADTSVLIDHLRGDVRARRLLVEATERGEELFGSVLTRTEVLSGMRSTERRATAALLSALRWVPVDEALADAAGTLARKYRRSHPGVDAADYVIAATVEALDAELWTRNVRHFPMLAGLHPPYS